MKLTAGDTALVTGASSGIGAEFARQLAGRGVNLILVARRGDRLAALREELVAVRPGLVVDAITEDLADPAGASRLVAEIGRLDRTVDALINNAGVGSHGPFAEDDPATSVGMVMLNCAALTELTARLLPPMIGRKRGLVVNVSSTAGFQPVASMAVYAATKAYVLSFTEALWAESRGTGVRVFALCPGATATEFFARTGKDFMTHGRQDAAHVVGEALDHVEHGGPSVTTGLTNRLGTLGYRFVPRRLMAQFSGLAVRAED